MIEKISGHEVPLEVSAIDPSRFTRNPSHQGHSQTAAANAALSQPKDEIHVSSQSAENTGGDSRSSTDEKSFGLSPDDKQALRELRATDQQVRREQQTHKKIAGDLAPRGPEFQFEVGPDGRRYAINGDVRIQLGTGRTPEETIELAERAFRAATAPAQPDARDRTIAKQARQMIQVARHRQQETTQEMKVREAQEGPASIDPSDIQGDLKVDSVADQAAANAAPPKLDAPSGGSDMGTGVDAALVTNGTNTHQPVVDELNKNAEHRSGDLLAGETLSLRNQAAHSFKKTYENAGTANDVVKPVSSAEDLTAADEVGEAEMHSKTPMERAIEAYGKAANEHPEEPEEHESDFEL